MLRVIDRFQAAIPDEQVGAVLNGEQQKNQVIEGVVNEMRQRNPQMEEILNKLIEW